MKRKQMLKNIEKILEYIYPPKCGFCGKLEKSYVCNKCMNNLKNIHTSGVLSNKKMYEKSDIGEIFFDELMYIFRYETKIREILIAYKFSGSSYLYKSIVNFLLKDEKMVEKIKKYDTIIPVPVSEKRYNKRGYNQSYLVANEIGKIVGIKRDINVIRKTKDIPQQSSLSKEERKYNVKNAYELLKKNMCNERILLVDDIYTTGNTVNEICKELRKYTTNEIGVLVIAKD